MIDGPTGERAAQAATHAPAHDGGKCGGAAAASWDRVPVAGPMACHIGHISPQGEKDGHLTVEVWDKHVRVKRPCHITPTKAAPRGVVKGMSPRSGRRLRWAIENTPALSSDRALFICLTYPAMWERDGRKVKRHLDTFGKRCCRIGAYFAWALEYQTRGAPHFHLLARFPDSWDIRRVREWVASSWFDIVGSGDENHLRAGTSAEWVNNPECAGWYIGHYLGKEFQKIVPDGVTLPGRMWGMIGCKPPEPVLYRFQEGNREGINLVRNIRRWASSEHACRQRVRQLSAKERKDIARFVRNENSDLADALLDFRDTTFTTDVPPAKRKSWSPNDPGREKGFAVRGAASVSRKLLDASVTAVPIRWKKQL